MKVTKFGNIFFAAAVVAVVGTSIAYADDGGQNVIYVGAGKANSSSKFNGESTTPATLGYLRLSNTSDVVLGLDIAGEGTMLDSTWGQRNSVKQAMSINLLIGTNIAKTENSRYDFAVIAGAREKTSSCPSSYLGYQCYANSKPDTTHAFNYGLVLTWSYKNIMVGARLTGESKQALLGLRF